MAKRTIKLNIKLPSGVTATREIENKAKKAAEEAVADAVKDLVEAQNLAKDLAAKGIQITADELISRKVDKRKSRSKSTNIAKGTRKRVVLSDTKRKNLVADLKAGGKIKDVAKKYGVSSATVMNIKTKAGLTSKRK